MGRSNAWKVETCLLSIRLIVPYRTANSRRCYQSQPAACRRSLRTILSNVYCSVLVYVHLVEALHLEKHCILYSVHCAVTYTRAAEYSYEHLYRTLMFILFSLRVVLQASRKELAIWTSHSAGIRSASLNVRIWNDHCIGLLYM